MLEEGAGGHLYVCGRCLAAEVDAAEVQQLGLAKVAVAVIGRFAACADVKAHAGVVTARRNSPIIPSARARTQAHARVQQHASNMQAVSTETRG